MKEAEKDEKTFAALTKFLDPRGPLFKIMLLYQLQSYSDIHYKFPCSKLPVNFSQSFSYFYS